MSFLLLFFFIVTQYAISDGNFYCYRRIFEDSSNLTALEINELCSLISKDDRFILRFPLKHFIDPSLYIRDNKEEFLTQCTSINSELCNFGYGIALYNNDISTLCVYSKELDVTIDNVLNTIKSDLYKDNTTIDIIKFLIQSIIDINPSSSSHIIEIDNKTDPDNNDKNISNINPLLLIIIILIPLCFICIVIYSIAMINRSETLFPPFVIHDHLTKLMQCYREIDKKKNNSIPIDKCTLCFNKIIPHYHKMTYEMKEMTKEPLMSNIEIPIDDMNIRFSCGHVYHNMCLHRSRIEKCLMCSVSEDNAMITVNNTNSTQRITKKNIIKLIMNLALVYDSSDLSHYNEIYRDEISKIKDEILLNND